jgi:flagellar biosynthesis/type III secretory pathway ATPase
MQRDMKDKDAENEELDRKARELKSQVEQRQQIIDLKSAGTNDNDMDKSKKFKVVANARKMKDMIQQQEEEIMFLQDELDRLRARTFPSFAHLQNRD